jgi:D-sedoheptulose 7-phosphate isomerase
VDAEDPVLWSQRGYGGCVLSAEFINFARDYGQRLAAAVDALPLDAVDALGKSLLNCWRDRRQVFIFGNGGSAGNAIHLANDYLYGISRKLGHALRVTALPANSAVLTCLANDEGYDEIFCRQLAVLAQPGDVAIAFSGSGNSPNVLKALEWCRANDVRSFSLLGFSGGKAKDLTDVPIHVAVDDMQISEDLQLIVGHMLMQWLYRHHESIAHSGRGAVQVRS